MKLIQLSHTCLCLWVLEQPFQEQNWATLACQTVISFFGVLMVKWFSPAEQAWQIFEAQLRPPAIRGALRLRKFEPKPVLGATFCILCTDMHQEALTGPGGGGSSGASQAQHFATARLPIMLSTCSQQRVECTELIYFPAADASSVSLAPPGASETTLAPDARP